MGSCWDDCWKGQGWQEAFGIASNNWECLTVWRSRDCAQFDLGTEGQACAVDSEFASGSHAELFDCVNNVWHQGLQPYVDGEQHLEMPFPAREDSGKFDIALGVDATFSHALECSVPMAHGCGEGAMDAFNYGIGESSGTTILDDSVRADTLQQAPPSSLTEQPLRGTATCETSEESVAPAQTKPPWRRKARWWTSGQIRRPSDLVNQIWPLASSFQAVIDSKEPRWKKREREGARASCQCI